MSIEITDWLRGLGLEQYATAFHDNAIDAEFLRELTADDLKDTLIKHWPRSKRRWRRRAGSPIDTA
jgi:hypothetical protein